MKNKARVTVLFLAVMHLPLFFAYPDVIHLKSGEKISGKIWKKELNMVTIASDTEKGIVPVVVLRDDIKKIERVSGSKELIKDLEKSLHYLEEGDKYFELGLYDQAIVFYKNNAKINPKFQTTYYKLGLAYLRTGSGTQARQSFNTALKLAQALKDKDAETLSFIAKVKVELKNLEEDKSSK